APEYAAHLVAIARALLPGASVPPLAAAMARRAQIESRVGAILATRRNPRWTGALGVPALLLFGGAMAALAAARPAQTAPAAPLPSFEAASVKPAPSRGPGEHSSEHSDPVHLIMMGTVHRFIIRAYGITDHQLAAEPGWCDSDLFTINGVTATASSESQKMLMLRRLLAERFGLQLREEQRSVPGYALEIAPGGPKFHQLKPGERLKDPPELAGTFARSFASMDELVNSLNGVYGGRLHLDRPVVDRTGLTGRYAMVLQTEMDRQADAAGGRGLIFPNLAHDLEAQLGLKLASERIPLPTYVVIHATRPTPN
ncbi:MAG: TIGR03435 family protein, partial [Terriglobales bacterium]